MLLWLMNLGFAGGGTPSGEEGGAPVITPIPIFGVNPHNVEPKGFQSLTISTSAVGLSVPAGAHLAICRLRSDVIRYRDDGVDPTSTAGIFVKEDEAFAIFPNSLGSVRFIRDASSVGDATLDVAYYGLIT